MFISKKEKGWSDKWYTKLIELPGNKTTKLFGNIKSYSLFKSMNGFLIDKFLFNNLLKKTLFL